MLGRIMRLLETHGSLSLGEIAAALESTPEAVEPMMELLAVKERIELASSGCSGKNCAGCFCSSRKDALTYRLSPALTDKGRIAIIR